MHKDSLILALCAVFFGVIVGLVPGYVSELAARADHSKFEVGIAVVYGNERTIIQRGLVNVRDCDAIIDALPVGNDVAHFECVRVQ